MLRWPFTENDRAQAERDTAGLVKIVARRNGRILGASILGAGAGELIMPWALAISQRLKIGALAKLMAPYPDSRRGRQARRRQLLHARPVFAAHPPARALPRAVRLRRSDGPMLLQQPVGASAAC